jgi:hypothetical protein
VRVGYALELDAQGRNINPEMNLHATYQPNQSPPSDADLTEKTIRKNGLK